MADRRKREEELEQLTAYVDGELPDAERAKVERLIADDPEAARLLDELGRTSQLLRALPRATASAGFAAHIADRLEREALLGAADAGNAQSPRPLRWMRPLSVAAGFVLVATAGWLLWPQVQPRAATESRVAVRPLPSAVPGDKKLSGEEQEPVLALKSVDRSFARIESDRPAEIQESESRLRADRSNEAPLALAPAAISAPKAKSRSTATDLAAAYRTASAVRQQTTTSAPTSAPTTTSAPASSQPTTRSVP